MSPELLEPRRLRENPQGPSSVEGRLARQLRILSVYAPTPQLRRTSALPRRRRYLLATIRLAAVAALILAVSGVATATAAYVVHRVWPSPPTVGLPPASSRSLQAPQGRRPSRRDMPLAIATVGLPAAEAEVTVASSRPAAAPARQQATPPLHTSRPVASIRSSDSVSTQPRRMPQEEPAAQVPPIEPAALPSPPMPIGTLPGGAALPGPTGRTASQVRTDGVTQEAGILRQALSALRRDHDARRALVLLDDYDRRFDKGALSLEATSARAQALLQLGDNARALELLDRLPLWQEKHTGELRVIRGELRSLSGRCQEALSDFDDVLRATAGSAPSEVARALYGRASCRARTGDLTGAEQDRQRYLKEFPKGPAARQLTSPP